MARGSEAAKERGNMTTEHLVITGRSGAGVSTTAVNLSAALAEMGYRVAHLGYDRRRISTGLLRGSAPLKAACGNACKEACNDTKFHCAIGFQDILCIECGVDGEADVAPEFAIMRRMELMARFRPDFVVHDVAGEPETVLPFLRHEGEPTRLFVVTSADFAALTTLNLFLGAIASESTNGSRFGGVIANNISGPFFKSLVDDFTLEAGSPPIVSVPNSLMVSVGEYGSQTVIESAPKSHLSFFYRKLARLVVLGLDPGKPHPLDSATFSAWLRKWSEITEELESGFVRDGAGI
jgi:nitrogenase iron protein NifH